MGGQDGFVRDPLNYSSTSNAFMAGLHYGPGKKWDFDVNFTWTNSDAKLDPFDLSAPNYSATHASMSFDFSRSHTYSNLDITRIDAGIGGRYKFNDDFWMNLRYRYADYQDDAPYMYDTSGTLNWIMGSLGWSF